MLLTVSRVWVMVPSIKQRNQRAPVCNESRAECANPERQRDPDAIYDFERERESKIHMQRRGKSRKDDSRRGGLLFLPRVAAVPSPAGICARPCCLNNRSCDRRCPKAAVTV